MDRTCILNESQISTEDGSTEYDTGKTKITCYYTASLRTWLDQTEWSHNRLFPLSSAAKFVNVVAIWAKILLLEIGPNFGKSGSWLKVRRRGDFQTSGT